MRKDELIEALRKLQRRTRRKSAAKGTSLTGGSGSPAASEAESGSEGDKPAGRRKRAVSSNGAVGKATRAKGTVSKASAAKSGKTAPGKTSVGKTAVGQVSASGRKSRGAAAPAHTSRGNSLSRSAARPATAPRVVRALRRQQAAADHRKDLSASVLVNGVSAKKAGGQGASRPNKDRIVLIVRDSYWLQASWEITRASVERARAAMAANWHTAQPVLRLLEVAHGASANAAEQVVRDIPIHGGVSNWYIDVENPPSRYRVVIGYKATSGKFYTLCRSNVVQTPAPGACDPIDGHWQDIAEDYERIYSLSDNENGTGSGELREMFEERLRRPMVDSRSDNYGAGTDLALHRERELPFEVDAELIVYGSTAPGATVTLAGEPIRLRPDGTFTVRMELPDRRQVLPVVACSRDGLRQRTTVVAVERNTKVMEPVSKHQLD